MYASCNPHRGMCSSRLVHPSSPLWYPCSHIMLPCNLGPQLVHSASVAASFQLLFPLDLCWPKLSTTCVSGADERSRCRSSATHNSSLTGRSASHSIHHTHFDQSADQCEACCPCRRFTASHDCKRQVRTQMGQDSAALQMGHMRVTDYNHSAHLAWMMGQQRCGNVAV